MAPHPAALLAVASAGGAATARAQALPPRAERTVAWYAANPGVLAYVTDLCRDDPGHLRADPDCVNAAAARALVAQRQAEATYAGRTGRTIRPDLTPPSSPRYWADRPGERAEKLAYCARMTPAQQANFFCAPARQAEAAAGGSGARARR